MIGPCSNDTSDDRAYRVIVHKLARRLANVNTPWNVQLRRKRQLTNVKLALLTSTGITTMYELVRRSSNVNSSTTKKNTSRSALVFVCVNNSFRFHKNLVRVTYAIHFSIQRHGNGDLLWHCGEEAVANERLQTGQLIATAVFGPLWANAVFRTQGRCVVIGRFIHKHWSNSHQSV